MTAPNDPTDSARAADGSQEQANDVLDVAELAGDYHAAINAHDIKMYLHPAMSETRIVNSARPYILALEADRDRLLAAVETANSRIRLLEDAAADVEMRLQENSELLAGVLDRAIRTGYTDEAKRKISEAWKWAYYASAIHLQIALGGDVRDAYRAKVAAMRAKGDAFFAAQAKSRKHRNAGRRQRHRKLTTESE